METPKNPLEKHIRTIRLIAEHREREAEKKLIKDFSKCVSDINGFLGNEYAKYAENDELTSEILHQKGEYARFIEEVINKYDNITLETHDTIQSMVEQTYKLCYDGMVEAVAKSNRTEDLHKALQAIQAATPEVIKKSVENPIPKLRLTPVMERNRKRVISGIKREITTGLSLGDRMSTMAGRISKQVNLGYTQSMLIARTEGHRVREGGFNDAAQRTNEVLKENDSEYRMVKIWKTMKDGAVRRVNKHNSADHAVMDGQIVPQDEKFILSDGSKADCPGSSGVAAQDCNCRCYISREIMNDEEYFKATGRHFEEENEQKPLTKGEDSGIIEENSAKAITKITDTAIERVPKVKIDGYTDKQCEYIQQQHKELLRFAKDNNDNKEVAFVFDKDFNKSEPIKGSDDMLELGTALMGKGNNLFVMHNHPRNSSFSATDIKFFKNEENVKTLTIVKNNGAVERLTKSSEYNNDIFKLEYDRMYKKIVKNETEQEYKKFIKKLLTKTKSGVIWSEE